MARSIGMAADGTVFRAVIRKKYKRNEEPFTTYEGPYGSAAAARARVTFWQNNLAELDDNGNVSTEQWATGHVESGTVAWTRYPR